MGKIFSFIIGLVLAGLAVALLRQFDWNFVDAAAWIAGLFMDIVNTIADFFQGNPTFQEYVVKD